MKALLAGYGGIGSNVYYPELKKLGYEAETLDTSAEGVTYKDISQIDKAYDIAVICTPNFTHGPIATELAKLGTKRIFIEKPGLATSDAWKNLCNSYPNTQFHLVKNNLYRLDYGNIFNMNHKKIIGVDINWLNGNRIPNPGSWFTTKHMAFGGISRDLMPHLYCFAIKLFGAGPLLTSKFNQASYKRWDLKSITTTDYGTVYPDGTYDVDDTALAAAKIGDITLKMSASWKEGYDKQSVTLFFDDGTTYEWSFGLCPADAYGRMLQDTTDTFSLDVSIHEFLENFND